VWPFYWARFLKRFLWNPYNADRIGSNAQFSGGKHINAVAVGAPGHDVLPAKPRTHLAGRYLDLRRRWSSGDTITVKFSMTPQAIEANPRVVENYGSVAVQRGGPRCAPRGFIKVPRGVPQRYSGGNRGAETSQCD
jgi:hypothetical protein